MKKGISKFELDCGVKVIYQRNTTDKTGIILHFPVGSLWEKENQKGLAHLVEHLAFKSTSKYTTSELLKKLEINGADINAHTSFDFTDFYFTSCDEHFVDTLDLMVEMLTDKNIPEHEFQKEKSIVIQELKMNKDNALSIAYLDSYKNALNMDPVIGFEDTLNKMTLKQVYAWFNKYIVREGMTISIVTGLSIRKVKKILNSAMLKFRAGDKKELDYAKSYIKKQMKGSDNFITYKKKKDQQNTIVLSLPLNITWDECAIKKQMLVDILSEGLTSILFREVREKYGYCYSINALESTTNTLAFKDVWKDRLFIYTSCTPEYTNDCIKVIKEVLFNLPKLITKDDLIRVKNMRKVKEFETIDIADKNIGWYLTRGNIISQDTYTKKYNQITFTDFMAFLGGQVKDNNLGIAICGPKFSKIK